MCKCLHVYMCVAHVCRCLWSPDIVRSPGTEINGHCELPSGNAENRAQVLCRSCGCCCPRSCLFNPILLDFNCLGVVQSYLCSATCILLIYAFSHSFNRYRSPVRQANARIQLVFDFCLLLDAVLVSRASCIGRINGFLRGWGPPPKQPLPRQINRALTLLFFFHETPPTSPLFQARASFSSRAFAS